MKNIIWAIVILAIVGASLLGSRYVLIVDSPVVAKLDRLTGDVWIVNSGVWMKIELAPARETAKTATEKIASQGA